jgi:hypothetical protein
VHNFPTTRVKSIKRRRGIGRRITNVIVDKVLDHRRSSVVSMQYCRGGRIGDERSLRVSEEEETVQAQLTSVLSVLLD